jgi:hypothetical protein
MHLRCLIPGEVAADTVLSDDVGFRSPDKIKWIPRSRARPPDAVSCPQELHVADPDPLVPFVRFAKSLWKVVNSQAMAKLVGSDGSL